MQYAMEILLFFAGKLLDTDDDDSDSTQVFIFFLYFYFLVNVF